jgi:hypothetical protein
MTSWWRRWQQDRARRAWRRADAAEERGFTQQWYLRIGRQPQSAMLAPDPAQLSPLYPPPDRFWADPFLHCREGRHWLFVEEYPFATRRGHIAAMEVDADGRPLGEMQPVLVEPECHLSYPFLLEVDGQLYMIPEKSGIRALDAYRCVRFPDQWVLEKRLFADMKFADATLFPMDGQWYLFTSAKIRRWRINDAVFGFRAEHPLATHWTPLNGGRPLVHDIESARPAGRIFFHDRHWYRPSQDCLRRYGHGLNINRIDLLGDTGYAETRVHHVAAEAVAPGNRAVHHIDWCAGLMVMDAQRLLPDAEVRR